MSLECRECERDLRGEHDESCSRHPKNKKQKVAMAEVTRKLLVVEVTNECRLAEPDEWFINDAQKGSVIHASEATMFSHPICKVHELPSAEELGRVAHEAQKFARQQDATYSYRQWGQAILDALTKRTDDVKESR